MATAIVTGGAQRLGQAFACHLARRGYHIALHHNATEPEDAVRTISETGVRCKTYRCNFTRLDESEQLVGKVVQDFDDVELLVNSAANFIQENVESTQIRTLEDTLHINLMTPYVLMREYKRRVGQGMIVNIVDQRILKNIPTFAAYSVSKVGLAHLTHLAAVEWGATVRVNAIAPGLITPPPGGPLDYPQQQAHKIPTRTHGDPDDLLKGIDYLIDSPFVNGETLFIDGGESKGLTQTTF